MLKAVTIMERGGECKVTLDFSKITRESIPQLQPVEVSKYRLEMIFVQGVSTNADFIATVLNQLRLPYTSILTLRNCNPETAKAVTAVFRNLRLRGSAVNA